MSKPNGWLAHPGDEQKGEAHGSNRRKEHHRDVHAEQAENVGRSNDTGPGTERKRGPSSCTGTFLLELLHIALAAVCKVLQPPGPAGLAHRLGPQLGLLPHYSSAFGEVG